MREYLFIDKNNPIVVECQEDGVVFPLSGLTKAELQLFNKKTDPTTGVVATFSVNSVDTPAVFDLTETPIGKIGFNPDDTVLNTLTANTYYGRFVLYFTNYPEGFIWGRLFKVEVSI